jgi:hypothetical protein
MFIPGRMGVSVKPRSASFFCCAAAGATHAAARKQRATEAGAILESIDKC